MGRMLSVSSARRMNCNGVRDDGELGEDAMDLGLLLLGVDRAKDGIVEVLNSGVCGRELVDSDIVEAASVAALIQCSSFDGRGCSSAVGGIKRNKSAK